MTMVAQTSRDPWRAVWQIATSDGLLIALLLGVAAGLLIAAWLPQMPAAEQPVAYAQWLSETQARFGETAQTLRTLGLFTVTRSLSFRTLLALLAGCLLLRLVENGDRLRRNRDMAEPSGAWQSFAGARLPDLIDNLRRWRYRILSNSEAELSLFQADRWPQANLFLLLAHGGALLILTGLLLTYLWGWRVEGLVVQSSEQVTLPGIEKWVAWDEGTRKVRHSPGIVTSVEECGPGVQVTATDGAGQPLSLKQATETDPVTDLTIALTEDRYFAIPQAHLVTRLTPQPGHAIEAHTPALVQIYRSPPGQLIAETIVEGDTELAVADVTLQLVSVPYARLTATFNPGLWPTGIGIILSIVGLLGSAACPARRFWLREGTEHIEGTGDLPSVLVRGREA